jgi:hypothetical protein
VVDTSATPIAGALVWAHQSRGRAWTDLQTRVDEWGRFAIHGARESTVTIEAEKLHYLPARMELPPGNAPLTLVLQRPGTIEGSVILDANCDPTILVVATDAGIRRPLTKDGTFSFGGFGTERVTFSLHCSDLPFEMNSSSSDRPALATFTTDAVAETKVSVTPIDLRGKLLPVLVTVVDEKGAAIPEYELTVFGKPPEKKTWTSPAPLLVSKPVDLQVAAKGKRLAKLEQVTRDVTVVLREPHRVTVRFKGLPETLPPDVTLLATLQPIGGSMAFIPDARASVEPDGTATLGLPFPGPWQAGATLRRVTPSMTHYTWASAVKIRVEEIDADQTFEVTIDPKTFAESLKRLLEQRP